MKTLAVVVFSLLCLVLSGCQPDSCEAQAAPPVPKARELELRRVELPASHPKAIPQWAYAMQWGYWIEGDPKMWRQHGKTVVYDAKGSWTREEWWAEGELHGRFTIRHGEFLNTESEWVDGKEHGMHRGWHESTGKLFFEGNFLDGKPDGCHRFFFDSGNRESEMSFQRGKREGIATCWYESGVKRSECTYRDDKLHGTYSEWDESGTLTKQVVYESGKEK